MIFSVRGSRRRTADESFSRIFRAADPYSEPFRPEIRSRMLLFPIFDYALGEEQLAAIAEAAAVVGERRAFVMDIEAWDKDRQVWELDLADYASYTETTSDRAFALTMHSLFSTEGGWGLLTDSDFLAVVGGPDNFIATLKAHIRPTDDEMAREWLAYWWAHSESIRLAPSVMDSLLVHVYGREQADALREKAEVVTAMRHDHRPRPASSTLKTLEAIARDAGILLLHHRDDLRLVRGPDALSFIDALEAAGSRIRGLEGFHPDGTRMARDDWLIADFSNSRDPKQAAAQARRFIQERGQPGVLYEFVIAD